MARKAPRTASAPAPERHALLDDALHTGVLAFLTLHDTAVALNRRCRALRNDSQLTLVVLLETGPATKYSRHMFPGCGSDWFATGDRALDIRAGRDCDAKIVRLFEKCGEDEHIAFDTGAAVEPTSPSASAPRGSCRSNPLHDTDISQRSRFFAQLLSLIPAFDTLVLPLLPEKEKANVDTTTPYWSDENIHFVLMAIVICLYLPKRQDTQQEWARDDVRKALNAYIGKLGNSFLTPTTSTPTASSAGLGVSSETVVAVTQSHSSVKCDLCAKTTATMQYTKANRGCMEDLYTQMIRNELVEGGFSAQEIEVQLHQLDRHTKYDLQGDDLLRHVLHQNLMDLPRVACVT